MRQPEDTPALQRFGAPIALRSYTLSIKGWTGGLTAVEISRYMRSKEALLSRSVLNMDLVEAAMIDDYLGRFGQAVWQDFPIDLSGRVHLFQGGERGAPTGT